MSVLDNSIGEHFPLYRNQLCLRAIRLHVEATEEHKICMDALSLEENARTLDSLSTLKRAIDETQKWRDANKELILAQYN